MVLTKIVNDSFPEPIARYLFWLAGRLFFYPKVLRNLLQCYLDPTREYFTEITENVYLGCAPLWFHVRELKANGITAVVNMCEEYYGPVATYRDEGIAHCHIRAIDYSHPKLEEVAAAVEFVQEQVRQGGKVLVHCKSGKGRSATVVLCHLVKEGHGNITEVYYSMKKKRHFIAKDLPHRPVVKKYLEL